VPAYYHNGKKYVQDEPCGYVPQSPCILYPSHLTYSNEHVTTNTTTFSDVPLGIVGIILLSASLLFLWFVILAGVTTHTPLDKIYFLRADTSGITGARPITQWTYFFFCGPGNNDCGPPRPAPAFGKAWDGRAANVPGALIGSHGGNTTSFHYYYTWRFGWVFFLLTLFFSTLAWFASFLACCGRLGAAIASFIALIALGFMTLGTSLMTAVFVQARNRFHDAGRGANVGAYAFGFIWASWACLFLASILFCLGIRNKEKGYSGRSWRRKRSVRSSRSYDGRRVKDDYS
jgi:hypothetical protein